MTDDLCNVFFNIRDFISDGISLKINTFFCDEYDPLNNYVVIQEMIKIIRNEAFNEFPEYPPQYFPKCKIKVDRKNRVVEVGIQNYFEADLSLIFLANIEIDGIIYDLYCRRSMALNFDYDFIARYGHEPDMKHEGSKTAAAEYMLGYETPLAIAFSFAIEEGFVS